jgi:hypothetical protein
MEDEIYQLMMQFLSNDKQAVLWHKEGKIAFDSMLKMQINNADNYVRILSNLSKFVDIKEH